MKRSPNRLLAALGVLCWLACAALVGGCGPDEPYCGNLDDVTGRAVVFCPNGRQDPVCDLPGDEAHFDDGPMGFVLVGAERASCNTDRVVECPMGTVGEPYCVTDPEL